MIKLCFIKMTKTLEIICHKIYSSACISYKLFLLDDELLFYTLDILIKLGKLDFATEIFLLISTNNDDLYLNLLCYFAVKIERNFNSIKKKKISCVNIFIELEQKTINNIDDYDMHDICEFMNYDNIYYKYHFNKTFDGKLNKYSSSLNLDDKEILLFGIDITWSKYYYSTGEMLEIVKDIHLIPMIFWKYTKYKIYDRYDDECYKYQFLSKAENANQEIIMHCIKNDPIKF